MLLAVQRYISIDFYIFQTSYKELVCPKCALKLNTYERIFLLQITGLYFIIQLFKSFGLFQ